MKAFAPLSRTLPFWPADLFGPAGGILDLIGISDFDIDSNPSGLSFSGKLAWLQEIEFPIPAIDGATFALLDAGGFTEVGFNVALAPEFSLTFGDLTAEFRFVSDALKPVTWDAPSNSWIPVVDSNTGLPKPAAFAIGNIYLHVDGDGQVDFVDNQGNAAFPTITPPALQLGDSGIVLEIHQVQLYLSDKQAPPPGAPAGFKGVTISDATLHLGDRFGAAAAPNTVTIDKLMIGSSGFSGTISAIWTTPGQGELFGLKIGLNSLKFTFSQNRLIGSQIKAVLTLPFFDEDLNVTIGYDAKGGLTLAIDAAGGIFTLTKPGFVEVDVDSIAIDIKDNKAVVRLSGMLTPLYGGLDWPSFEIRDLSIDSDGHVKLEGGWIDLPTQKALQFYAFTVEITKFGFGRTDGGGRWVGFSGKVNLIKGVQGNASVDGLRIILGENGGISFTLNGVGVDMKIAGAFELKGSVKFTDLPTDKRFDGAAQLSLDTPELVFDSQVTIGEKTDPISGDKYKYFAMYGGLELPTGIPLGPSGVALFGFAGLLALNMVPGRATGEAWYSLTPPDWYHKATVGVNDLEHKWVAREGGKAFGAGLTLGTYADNGFTFNARALLVLAFPGPLIMIEGRGNILKDRKALAAGDEPLFRAIAILDEEAGEYTFGLDAFYQYDKASGDVITIRGSVEAFYAKANPHGWHIWLGKKDPTASRIQAKIITLFQANSYFMIDADKLQMGAWIGYDKQWNPGPLHISLQAWLDANAIISFKPNHFYADLWLHAAIELSAFGIGAGLNADAMLAADIMDPFHIKGELSVSLKLPWPLKTISKDLSLEWGPSGPPPPIPIVLQGVGIQHPKSSAVWPLALNSTLLPSYDDSNGYLTNPTTSGDVAPPQSRPVVPMDCRPIIAFGRAVHDDAAIGVNALPRVPDYDQIGDPTNHVGPTQVRFALRGVVLQKRIPASGIWAPVSGKGDGAGGLPELFGSWAIVPSGAATTAVDQTKLMLWSKTPYDHTRLTGNDWNAWSAKAYPDYPCVTAPAMRCYDFKGYETAVVTDANNQPVQQFDHRDNAQLLFASQSGFIVETLATPIDGKTHVLRPRFQLASNSYLYVILGGLTAPTGLLRILFDNDADKDVTVYIGDANGVRSTRQFTTQDAWVEVFDDDEILGVMIVARGRFGVVEVCLGAGLGGADESQHLAANLTSAASVWSAQGNVLEPFTDYRLSIVTQALVAGAGAGTDAGTPDQTSYAYFCTGGPPSLGGFTVLDTQSPASIAAGPDSLTNYVAQTVPPTLGQDGEAPALPRPVFRAYDIGVIFNADYVDLLYKLTYRDLMLQILDSNGAMARDDTGRAVSFENPFGVTAKLTLDNASASWLSAVDRNCVPIDDTTIVHNQTVGTSKTFLDPDTRYRARLTPLLLHDDFSDRLYSDGVSASGNGARIGDWLVVELDTVAQSSRWTVSTGAGGAVTQDQALSGSATDTTECPPGSAFVFSPPTAPAWKSQRLSVFASSAAGGTIGVVFLYRGSLDCYLFTMRQSDGICRFVHRTGSGSVDLVEAIAPFAALTDVEIVIEVSDTAIRAFVDDAAVLTFETDLSADPGGSVGLWCWNNAAARFKDARIEDQSGTAAVPYSFEFVTSDYVDYFHLAQARRTPVWDIETGGTTKERSAVQLGPLTSSFVTQSDAALSALETRQFEDLAALWLGPGLVLDPTTPEVHRILRNGDVLGWLVRSPEPWDWKRSQIVLARAAQDAPLSDVLGPVKLTGAALGVSDPNDEYVDLLTLEDVTLAGWRLELRDAFASQTGLVETPFDDPASQWLLLYAFSSTEILKAGLQIRLYSGGLVRPPADHTHRTMNIVAPGNPGVARLAAVGVDLRLVDPTGRTACAVRVLSAAAFAQVPTSSLRLLRKGDATALIVLPNAGAAIAAGTYGLQMTYRRDLTASDPNAIVLSLAGDTSNEQAFVLLR